MGLQRFPIGDFRGGWNIRDPASELEPNEAQDVLNVDLTPIVGSLASRKGKTKFTSTFIFSNAIQNMRAWYPNDTTKLLIVSSDGVIQVVGAGGVLVGSGHTGTA